MKGINDVENDYINFFRENASAEAYINSVTRLAICGVVSKSIEDHKNKFVREIDFSDCKAKITIEIFKYND